MPAAVETMAYVTSRGLPWHREGNGIPELATAGEMLDAAGLNWSVNKVPVVTVNGAASVTIPNKVATVRSTDGAVLGIVGPNYRVFDNADAFAFADAIVADNGNHYETAGSLYGGSTVFLSMELNSVKVRVNGEAKDADEFKTFLLISNSHDGSKALQATITPVRVVCANTLNMALGSAKASFKVRHSGDLAAKMNAARDALGVTVDYMARFEQVANDLMARRLPDNRVEPLMLKVFPRKADASDGWVERSAAKVATDLYFASSNLDPIRGTGWAFVNAVAEYVDHEVQYAGRDAFDTRANAILWGRGLAAKQRSLVVANTIRRGGGGGE